MTRALSLLTGSKQSMVEAKEQKRRRPLTDEDAPVVLAGYLEAGRGED